jgi:hypothetical protein
MEATSRVCSNDFAYRKSFVVGGQIELNRIFKENMMFKNSVRRSGIATLAIILGLVAIVGIAPIHAAGNPNPGVIPNQGPKYAKLGATWWQWAYSFPATEVPFFNTGGPVDISAGQSGHVWFLAGANSGPATRTGVIPSGTSLFFPLANLINDYPCPPEFGFEPDPGETLEHFLQRTGNDFLPNLTDLFAEIDGVPLTDLSAYRATSSLFRFTADPALSGFFDPCVTGTEQDGVAVGYWLLLAPLPPGEHTLHFGAPSWGQDVIYVLTVTPGH